jgi:hypothetical protein
VRIYLAGIRSLHVDCGLADPIANCSRIKRMLRGMQRIQGGRRVRKRLPITMDILRSIHASLNFARHDHRLLFAAMACATAGLFRTGEVTVDSARSPDPRRLLTFSSIKTIYADNILSHYIITLQTSKTDPFNMGSEVPVSHPVALKALFSYFSHHPIPSRPSLPLFCFADGSPLTRATLLSSTKACLDRIKLDYSKYSGLSFRRGGATSLDLAGVQDRHIKLLGRWKGWSYSRYTETPTASLINLGKRM